MLYQQCPAKDVARSTLNSKNKVSTLFVKLLVAHSGLILAILHDATLPFNPCGAAAMSIILMLLLWSDTTHEDTFSRAVRQQLRNFVGHCISFAYLVVSVCYAESYHIELALTALCIWLLYTFGHNTEQGHKTCAMCGTRLPTDISGKVDAATDGTPQATFLPRGTEGRYAYSAAPSSE